MAWLKNNCQICFQHSRKPSVQNGFLLSHLQACSTPHTSKLFIARIPDAVSDGSRLRETFRFYKTVDFNTSGFFQIPPRIPPVRIRPHGF